MPRGIYGNRKRKGYVPSPNGNPLGSGRKPFKIDWEVVEALLIYGASGVQIASVLGMCPETLFHHTKKEKKMEWCDYRMKFWEKGNAGLLGKQYKLAMEGDRAMLIWLGKQRLNQSEKIESKIQTTQEVKQKAILQLPDNGRREVNDSPAIGKENLQPTEGQANGVLP